MSIAAQLETDCDFHVARIFNAPRTLVFEAWTDPRLLAQWWGPHGFTNPVCEVDARTGGTCRIVMRSPEGEDYPISGEYRNVVEPETLAMTVDCCGHPREWHDLVNANGGTGKKNAPGDVMQTVTFDNLDGKTRLAILMRFESVAVRNAMIKIGMHEGWSQSLDRLATLLAQAC
jgi:uncharacterized protein YndB with AHSA1/START domain